MADTTTGPWPAPAAEESAADRYRRLSATFGATVTAVPADAWDRPSPCADWSARDVLQHVLDTTTWQATQVGLELPTGSAAGDPVAAWETTRTAVLEVLDDLARADLEYDGMLGRTTLAASYRQFYCFDLVVHRWDIAHATGVDEVIPPADLTLVRSIADELGELIRMEGVVGPEVEVPADADEQTRVLGHLGRTV